MGSFLWLEVRRTVRNQRHIIFTSGFPVGFSLIFTSIFTSIFGAATIGTGPGALALSAEYMVAMSVYGIIGATLNSNGAQLATERPSGWSRQLRVTPLAPAP